MVQSYSRCFCLLIPFNPNFGIGLVCARSEVLSLSTDGISSSSKRMGGAGVYQNETFIIKETFLYFAMIKRQMERKQYPWAEGNKVEKLFCVDIDNPLVAVEKFTQRRSVVVS